LRRITRSTPRSARTVSEPTWKCFSSPRTWITGASPGALTARSPHRGDAYAACRYAIERIKQIAPIWKREFFEGGDVWIEGAIADPDNQQARAEAERVACA